MGQLFVYQIIATGSPTSYDATNLPSPLIIDHALGIISGTPSVGGDFSVTLNASNAAATGTAPTYAHREPGTAIRPGDHQHDERDRQSWGLLSPSK